MHGSDTLAGSLLSYGDLEQRVGPDHPLRATCGLVNSAPMDLSAAFDPLYSPFGRASIPPERTDPCPAVASLLLDPFGTTIRRAYRV